MHRHCMLRSVLVRYHSNVKVCFTCFLLQLRVCVFNLALKFCKFLVSQVELVTRHLQSLRRTLLDVQDDRKYDTGEHLLVVKRKNIKRVQIRR